MSTTSRRVILCLTTIVVVFAMCFSWWVPSGAAEPEQTALDQIGLSYEIPITNPANHDQYPSVLVVESANLSTKDPDGSGVNAPPGKIFLSLQMTSRSSQTLNSNSVGWPTFFDGITPLPGSSLRYDASSGRRYFATRINPVNWNNTYDSSNPDGLVDATYYFTVPITNRKGTLVILPSHTLGYEAVTLLDGPLTSLNVGGPTKIPISFPKNLTVVAPRRAPKDPLPSAAAVVSVFNFASVLTVALFAIWIYRKTQRWRRRRGVPSPQPVYVVNGGPGPSPVTPTRRPQTTATTVTPTPTEENVPTSNVRTPAQPPNAVGTTPAAPPSIDESTLHVDVLGPLALQPTFSQPSVPVRAIISYLALHNTRVLTLDEIQTAIWPLTNGVNDVKRPVMLNYMADVRKVVGERHLPTASGKSGYQLVDVATDWDTFQKLVASAHGAPKTEALRLQRRALDLVRGVPFAGENSRYFTWALSTTVVYKIVDAVTTLAHKAATDAVLRGDLDGADKVLRQGLLCEPSSLTLWEDLTDVLLESSDQSKLRLHWRAADQVLSPTDIEALRAREHG